MYMYTISSWHLEKINWHFKDNEMATFHAIFRNFWIFTIFFVHFRPTRMCSMVLFRDLGKNQALKSKLQHTNSKFIVRPYLASSPWTSLAWNAHQKLRKTFSHFPDTIKNDLLTLLPSYACIIAGKAKHANTSKFNLWPDLWVCDINGDPEFDKRSSGYSWL